MTAAPSHGLLAVLARRVTQPPAVRPRLASRFETPGGGFTELASTTESAPAPAPAAARPAPRLHEPSPAPRELVHREEVNVTTRLLASPVPVPPASFVAPRAPVAVAHDTPHAPATAAPAPPQDTPAAHRAEPADAPATAMPAPSPLRVLRETLQPLLMPVQTIVEATAGHAPMASPAGPAAMPASPVPHAVSRQERGRAPVAVPAPAPIEVTIGRIEVQLVGEGAERPAPRTSAGARPPQLPLADYLRRRDGSGA